MCTISWIHDKDGYQLLCNRDEKLTRKSALEPRLISKRRGRGDGTDLLSVRKYQRQKLLQAAPPHGPFVSAFHLDKRVPDAMRGESLIHFLIRPH